MFDGCAGITAFGGYGDGPLQPVWANAPSVHREIINGPRNVTVVLRDNFVRETFQALQPTPFAKKIGGGGEL